MIVGDELTDFHDDFVHWLKISHRINVTRDLDLNRDIKWVYILNRKKIFPKYIRLKERI